MALISTRGRYALRVMVDMAEHAGDGYLPLRDIAERQDVSEKYLESILKALVKNRLLTGLRGKGGGYKLTRPPEKYTVGEILKLTEGSLAPVACLEDGAAACPRAGRCRTIGLWKGLYEAIDGYLSSVTVADLMFREREGDDYVI